MNTPIALSQLKDQFKSQHDVEIAGIGLFRLHRVGLSDLLALQTVLASFPPAVDDATQNAEQIDALLTATLPHIAKSLGGEFDSAEGVEALSAIGLAGKTKLLTGFFDLHRLSLAHHEEDTDAAKNE